MFNFWSERSLPSYCEPLLDGVATVIGAGTDTPDQPLAAVSGGRSPTLQAAWVAEAGVLSALGHNREALALVARVDPVAYQATTSDPGRAAVLKALHAQILLRLGRRDEGLPQLREALAQMQSQGVADEEMASFRQSLGPAPVASK